MRIRGLTTLVTLCFALLLTACGGGSGRQGTDLVVTAVGPTSAVLAGTNAVFEMTLANAGGNAASGVEVSLTPANPTSLTCSASGGAVCPTTLAAAMTVSMPAGARLTFTVTSLVAIGATGNVGSTLSARYPEDTDSFNNTATALVAIIDTAANLVVEGSGPAGTVTGGGIADFVMKVRNEGPGVATNVRLLNSVGNGLTLRSAGIVCVPSAGAACPAVLGPSMELASLPAGANLTFTVSATVSQGLNSTVTNSFSASADNDVVRTDNAFTATAAVVSPLNGVFVTGVGPSATVTGGGTAVFAMTVGNAGPDPAPAVSIVNDVGSNLTFTGITCVASNGAVCPATTGPVMTATNLPAGGVLVFTVNTQVASGISGTLTNKMTVSADSDTDRTDNVATAVATAATPRATLALTGTGPAATVAGGGTAVFSMTVSNTGPDAATGVRVLNTVGGNLTFTGARCTATAPAVCPSAASVVTDVGTLPVGGLLTFEVSAVVAAGTNGAITNTVQVTADNAFSPGGNTAVALGTAFTARSNLSIAGTGPVDVPSGTSGTFVMTLTNDGPEPAATVRLVNSVGGNLTLTGITCRALTVGATCPVATGVGMDVTNLPNQGQLEFTVTAAVALGTQGTVVNTMTATSTTGIRTETTAVAVGSAYSNNLAVTGEAPVGPVAGASQQQFTMTVTNSGSGVAKNVAVVHALSDGIDLSGAITCSGSACPSNPGLNSTITNMPAGGNAVFVVPVVVRAGVNAAVWVNTTATAQGDTRVQDNTATASVTAVSPDLAVTQTFAAQVTAGSTAVFTAVVNNPGSAAATGLVLNSVVTATDPLVNLSGVSIVCSAGSGATCPTTTGSTMSVPSLPAGRALTFTITLPLTNAAARGSLSSTFSVTAAGDPITSNNSSTVTTQVIDERNGTYTAFFADGRKQELVLDVDALRYTVSGMTYNLSADSGGVGYSSTGSTADVNVRLRASPGAGLVVGSHKFAGESVAVPYLAVRSFGSSLTELAGAYNLVTRNVTGTSAVNKAAVASITGNQLSVCERSDGTLGQPGSRCAPGAQTDYLLSVVVPVSGAAPAVYTATKASGPGASFDFYLAKSGGAKLLVSADATSGATSSNFRVALQETPGFLGGTLQGGSTSSVWVDSMVLTTTSYAVTGGAADAATATLAASAQSGVDAMLRGTRSGDSQLIWVMRSSALAIAFGDSTATGTAAGLLQMVAP